MKTVIFDAGNVLAFFSKERQCAQMAAVLQKKPRDIYEALYEKGLLLEYESGQLSSQEFLESLGLVDGLERAFCEIFEPNHTLLKKLPEFTAMGLRLVLLSNTNPLHYEHLEKAIPELSYFDKRILSYEVRACKPEPAIFTAAIAAAQCAPHDCFYTDDIPLYTSTAADLGIVTHTFTETDAFVKAFEAFLSMS